MKQTWQITASSKTHRLEQNIVLPSPTVLRPFIHTPSGTVSEWTLDPTLKTTGGQGTVRKSWVCSSLFSPFFVPLWCHQYFTVNATSSICIKVWVISKGARMHSCVAPFHFCRALELEDRIGFLKLLRVEIPSLKCKPLKWEMFHYLKKLETFHFTGGPCSFVTLQQSSTGT